MDPQKGKQKPKNIFEGVGGSMGRKIPFTLRRTEEALLRGPQVSWMFPAYLCPRKCGAVLLQLDDSLNCNLCLTGALTIPVLEGRRC